MNLEEFQGLVSDINSVQMTSLHSGVDASEATDPLQTIPDSPELSPFAVYARCELRQRLSSAVDDLPEKERLVISLYYVDELTMKEIGSILGVNESRVSQIHSKAVGRLRTNLDFIAA
jgi:RNA polymerase sigma factor for flagellar operon FliA